MFPVEKMLDYGDLKNAPICLDILNKKTKYDRIVLRNDVIMATGSKVSDSVI